MKHVEAAVPIAAAPLGPERRPPPGAINDIQPVASVDGLFFDQDRLAVIAGRMADPDRPDEIVMTAAAAQLARFPRRPGHPLRHLHARRRQNLPGFGTPSVAATSSASTPRSSGSSKRATPSSKTTSTDSRRSSSSPRRFGREIVADGGQGTGAITYGLQLDHGNGDVNAVEREFALRGTARQHLRLPRHRPRRGQGRSDGQAPGHRPRGIRRGRCPCRPAHWPPAHLPPTS